MSQYPELIDTNVELLELLGGDGNVILLHTGSEETFLLNKVPLQHHALVQAALGALADGFTLLGSIVGDGSSSSRKPAANGVDGFDQD